MPTTFRTRSLLAIIVVLGVAAGCTDSSAANDGASVDGQGEGHVDATDGGGSGSDAGDWVPGERTLSGTIFFFDADGVDAVELQKDVTAAEVYLLEHLTVRIPVAADGSYTFTDLPAGEYTVAVAVDDHERWGRHRRRRGARCVHMDRTQGRVVV
ncbi:MAG: hypothetical protein KC502_23065 [Myxococcales bacterium]|nr:hypothetical protein [Myxococcales bacterium]